MFKCVQQGLAAQGNEWVSLHREPGVQGAEREVSGTGEALLRNQYAAWVAGMLPGAEPAAAG